MGRRPIAAGLNQVSLITTHTQLAEAVLESCGALAITFTDAGDQPLYEPPPGMTPQWRAGRLTALFAPDVQTGDVIRRLRAILPEQEHRGIVGSPVTDGDWVHAWQTHARPLQFGRRLRVLPDDSEAPTRGAVVRLSPGLAFGTGTHPTTALCLDWLARARLGGTTVLDYGCGSGILAVAALKLGARCAVAVDHDPQALIAARTNARRNAVVASLRVRDPAAFARGRRRFDVILANILARPLIELAPLLIARLAPGGRLVLSGLLRAQGPAVRNAYSPPLCFARSRCHEGWLRLVARS